MPSREVELTPKPSMGSTLQEDSSERPISDDTRLSSQRSRVSLSTVTGGKQHDTKEMTKVSSDKIQTDDHGDDEILVVDWDGPEDPENPKK